MLTAGLMNPTVLFPAAMRASLTAAMTDAKMGAEADVPPEWTNAPPSAITSGHLVAPVRFFNPQTEGTRLTRWPKRRGTPVQTC
jgi:hypothetical protein